MLLLSEGVTQPLPKDYFLHHLSLETHATLKIPILVSLIYWKHKRPFFKFSFHSSAPLNLFLSIGHSKAQDKQNKETIMTNAKPSPKLKAWKSKVSLSEQSRVWSLNWSLICLLECEVPTGEPWAWLSLPWPQNGLFISSNAKSFFKSASHCKCSSLPMQVHQKQEELEEFCGHITGVTLERY